MNTKEKEFREQLINYFKDALNQPEETYYCPWLDLAAERNGVSKIKYKGINALMLNFVSRTHGYSDHRWFTFKQLMNLNKKLPEDKKLTVQGQHGTPVQFWSMWDTVERKAISFKEYFILKSHILPEQLAEFEARYRVFSRFTTVFNAEQVKNMETETVSEQGNTNITSNSIEHIAGCLEVELEHEEIDRAFYNPAEDKIHLPLANFFRSQDDYTATAIHELCHSTGHSSRLNRNLEGGFGSKSYALEELTAEMGSAFLGFKMSEDTPEPILQNHKAYIQNWNRILKDEPDEFLKAVGNAQKAADYIEEKIG